MSRMLFTMIVLVLSASAARAQDAYHLNPGDILRISVWNEEALQQDVLVLPDGTFSFPLVGIIDVDEKTPSQVAEELKAKLSRLIPDPEINVSVTSVSGNNFFIIGKVTRPGQFPMNSPTDVMQALSLAGGLTPYADAKNILLLRRVGGKQQIMRFDFTRVSEGKALESNILLLSGDTIVVP